VFDKVICLMELHLIYSWTLLVLISVIPGRRRCCYY